MADYWVRAMTEDGSVRALAAVTTTAVEKARRRHGTAPTATAALGRTLTAAGLIGAMLKSGQTVTVRILGDGPLGGVLATGDAAGSVRGYVTNPEVHLPLTPSRKLDVGGAVGRGTLHVTMDLGMRFPYHGSVPLVSGEIGEDLAAYFVRSQQIPSLVALGVLVSPDERVMASGGLIVQLMPGADNHTAAYLEERAKVLPTITSMVSAGRSPEEILDTVLGEVRTRVVARQVVRFACRCSMRKVEGVLVSLGERELREIVQEQRQVEVRCNFCGRRYTLDEDEVESLIQEMRKTSRNGESS